jgi:hypothetical protein
VRSSGLSHRVISAGLTAGVLVLALAIAVGAVAFVTAGIAVVAERRGD